MEESAQKVNLELTKNDKTFVRELIKIHLGINLTTEEDNEASNLDGNSYAITKEDDSESEVQVMKKTLIQEVVYQYLKKNTHESVRQLPLEESDINSNNVKGINRNESILEKPVDFNKNENNLETEKNKQSEMSKDFPFTPNQDYFDSNEVEILPVIEQTDSAAKLKQDFSNSFQSLNGSAKSITLTVKSEDVLMLEKNNDNYTFEQCEKNFPDYIKLEEDKPPSKSNFRLRDPSKHQLITQNNAQGLVHRPASSLSKFHINRDIFSQFQKWLTNNQLSPTACLYELCQKCKWPRPLFLCNGLCKQNEMSYMFDVYVRYLSFQGHTWTANKKTAKHLASVACLEYLGFECPFKKETASFMTKKRPSPMKKAEVKPIINDLKGKLLLMHSGSKQNTDKREVENTDLRLILDMKRRIKKNPSTTENSLLLGNPHEIGLM